MISSELVFWQSAAISVIVVDSVKFELTDGSVISVSFVVIVKDAAAWTSWQRKSTRSTTKQGTYLPLIILKTKSERPYKDFHVC